MMMQKGGRNECLWAASAHIHIATPNKQCMTGQQSVHNKNGKEKIRVRSTLRRATHNLIDDRNGTTPRTD